MLDTYVVGIGRRYSDILKRNIRGSYSGGNTDCGRSGMVAGEYHAVGRCSRESIGVAGSQLHNGIGLRGSSSHLGLGRSMYHAVGGVVVRSGESRVDHYGECGSTREDVAHDIGAVIALEGQVLQTVLDYDFGAGCCLEGKFSRSQGLLGTVGSVVGQNVAHGEILVILLSAITIGIDLQGLARLSSIGKVDIGGARYLAVKHIQRSGCLLHGHL